MILLCGIPSEPPLRLALEAAERLGIEALVLNQRHASALDIAIDFHQDRVDATLWAWEREWRLGAIDGIYNRLIDPCELPEFRPRPRRAVDSGALAKVEAFNRILSAWFELAPCRVASRGSAITSNISKPYQSQLIARCGFAIPPTLVTNDIEAVEQFTRLHRRVIYKSVSSVRSIVRELGAADRLLVKRVRNLPTQFQAYIPGNNVRVHVAGAEVFATEIETEAVDYRYAGRDGMDAIMRPFALPDEIQIRCRVLAASLHLPFCGIDLKRTPVGQYYCLEVNPCPAYSYYQEFTGQPIADAVVGYLAGRTANRQHRKTRGTSRRKLGADQRPLA